MVGLGCNSCCSAARGNYRPLRYTFPRGLAGPRRLGSLGDGATDMLNAGYPQNEVDYLKQLGATDAQLSAVASGQIRDSDLINKLGTGVDTSGVVDSGAIRYVPGSGSGGSDISAAGSPLPKLSWSMPWWGWVAIGVGGLIVVRHV
jgi:hypothetical protein